MGETLKSLQRSDLVLKIKEVIEKTELTDRAIRLYMENGLIDPYCKEAYNGRKNIDFSEEDVEQLKNIALLRKAGFSIAEIKELQYGGESAKIAFTEFIEKTKENIEKNKTVLHLLESLENSEYISVKKICERLSVETIFEDVPEEDLKPSRGELAEKIIYYIVGIVGLIWSVLNVILIIGYYKAEFIYATFYEFEPEEALLIPIRMFFVIQLLLSLLIIILNKKPKKLVINERGKRIILKIVICLWLLSWFALPFSAAMISLAPPVYSYTENPQNYLVLDEYVRMYGNDIYTLFPANIPRSVISEDSSWYPPDSFPETTKYYYKYENMIDQSFDIVAEWKLPKEEYVTTKEAILDKDGIKAQKQKGDWKCIYFEDCENDDTIKHSFYFLVFAYNDKTNTVRYISSYCLDAANGAYTPYYFELEW